MPIPDGVRSETATTDRLETHWLETGPADGTPVVLVHGNLSSARFYDRVLAGAPDGYRVIAPDMRGFGDSAKVAIDATRGLRDWSDDLAALVDHLGITDPVHLVGWSTGGAAIAHYAVDRPGAVASLTFIDPVAPYGFGATRDAEGTPTNPDFAGSGGGVANPDFVQRLADGDATADADTSPRNIMRAFYWSPEFSIDPAWEDDLTAEILKALIGDEGYPGDSTPSEHWPMVAPGTTGILNALSGKYCRWDDLADVDPKPPVLWTHGEGDQIVANGSMFDLAALGELGLVPGWPGPEACPPQPMLDQIRAVLDRYAAAGGSVRTEVIAGSTHGPHIDNEARWSELFWGFVGGA